MAVAAVGMAVAVASMVAVVASMEASLAVAFVAVAPASQAEVLEAADLAGDTAEASAAVMVAMATTDMDQILPEA
jgi:hypothetical protein